MTVRGKLHSNDNVLALQYAHNNCLIKASKVAYTPTNVSTAIPPCGRSTTMHILPLRASACHNAISINSISCTQTLWSERTLPKPKRNRGELWITATAKETTTTTTLAAKCMNMMFHFHSTFTGAVPHNSKPCTLIWIRHLSFIPQNPPHPRTSYSRLYWTNLRCHRVCRSYRYPPLS